MNIFWKIAWRNIWRNPRRSWVLVTAIGIGIFSFVGATAFNDGFAVQMINATIDLEGGHIFIARQGYEDNPSVRLYIEEAGAVAAVLDGEPGLRYAPRITAQGMANSTERAAGVVIHGVDPAREAGVTAVPRSLVEGAFPEGPEAAGGMVMGAALARRLGLRLGEKGVLMVSDVHNDVSAGAYRIAGLYRTSSTAFDRTNVFLSMEAARALVGYPPDAVTSFSVRLDREERLDAVAARLRERLEPRGLAVRTWKERFPLLVLAMEAYGYSVVLLAVILFTAVAFSLVNAFLMVIFERIREIGVMMASGIRPGQIRLMLFLEAVFMLLLGTAVGGALSALVLGYWAARGLDLSAFAEGLGAFGIGAVVYPYFDWGHLGLGYALIVGMVFLAVLYPAYRAGRFEVVEALSHV